MKIEKPTRVEHHYMQRLNAGPDTIFPLLCPVKEVEWAAGWLPSLVVSESGFAERGCIFTLREKETESVWVVIEHDEELGIIEFVKVLPGVVVTEIRIELREIEPDVTEAGVTYRFTAISEDGKDYVLGRTNDWYLGFMQDWEEELNGYLART